ncbi:hypothetical protein [Sphingopyxis flava]|uniref:Uncharacterized protein n=1 Tax=Sphingopyxis flava TaxID=1507287 RepID=A0A1T5FDE4_9SPHN|nr:hypothetical protein [Sphingopyxis flava]SKB94172.1 hypothetical protein SAMN06295937_10336 [Sphingopyxis flava]
MSSPDALFGLLHLWALGAAYVGLLYLLYRGIRRLGAGRKAAGAGIAALVLTGGAVSLWALQDGSGECAEGGDGAAFCGGPPPVPVMPAGDGHQGRAATALKTDKAKAATTGAEAGKDIR